MWYMKRDPMPVFDLCAIKRFEENERHIHRVFDKSVLILMLSGVLRFEENGALVDLAAGEYYIQRPGLLQTGNRPSESPQYLFLHFTALYSQDPAEGLPIRGHCDTGTIQAAAEEFERRYRLHDSGFFSLNALMFQLFADLENGMAPQNSRLQIARDIQRFIAAEYASPLSLAKIAQRYGYSEDYTIRVFKNAFGITPYQYLIRYRLQQAERLLVSTDKPVETVSREVGYNDFSTFYRDFRKHYGRSPSELRGR